MTAIAFTQYLMPHGRRDTVHIDRPDDIAAKAEIIRAAGYDLTCEMLSDFQTISLTVEGRDGDFDIEIATNGPAVPAAVDVLITRAATRLEKRRANAPA